MFQISLAAARVNAKKTQREVANSMNVNVSTIANWENGKTSPNVEQFVKLCDLYNCPQSIIFLPKRFTLSE